VSIKTLLLVKHVQRRLIATRSLREFELYHN
jgi:hypothetical protein